MDTIESLEPFLRPGTYVDSDHPAVIASADQVIELGPEGGAAGGKIVAQGTPREVAAKKTATGLVLRELFARAG